MKQTLLRLCLLSMSCVLVSACSTSEDPDGIQADQIESKAHLTTLDSSLANQHEMVVYKSATCGCCKEWISYIERAGFSVSAIDTDELDAVKTKHGLTDPSLKSCHTAIVDGYVIEGHVPVNDIERLLAERPAIVGLTAPGMPMMSPGMASETPKDYDVLAFDKTGQTHIYSSY